LEGLRNLQQQQHQGLQELCSFSVSTSSAFSLQQQEQQEKTPYYTLH
jgi:hypothetical protein